MSPNVASLGTRCGLPGRAEPRVPLAWRACLTGAFWRSTSRLASSQVEELAAATADKADDAHAEGENRGT